jgi:hypothetical protein
MMSELTGAISQIQKEIERTRREILKAFGVPPEFLVPTETNRAVAEANYQWNIPYPGQPLNTPRRMN